MVVHLYVVLIVLLLALMWRLHVLNKPQAREKHKKHVGRVKSAARTVTQLQTPEVNHPPVTAEEIPTTRELEEREVPEALKQFKLLLEDELDTSIIEKIQGMTHTIQRPRKLISSLIKGVHDPKQLASLVKSDPEIAAKLLRVVNSSYFNLSTEITSIQHAVIYLGTAFVKDAATRIAIQNTLKTGDPKLERAYHHLWISSFVASSLGLRMGQMLNLPNASSLSTNALLSSIGNLAALSFKPELVDLYSGNITLFERTKHQQEILNANAAVMGGVLATHWELPPSISKYISQSLMPMAVPPKECTLTSDDLVQQIFCYLSCRLGDLVAFHGLRDIAEANVFHQAGLEFFYLGEYIHLARLNQFIENLQITTFRATINTLISRVATELD